MSGDRRDRRSGDAQLLLLQQKLDNHIKEYKQHCEDEEKRWGHLLVSQEKNTESINELTTSTKQLTESTRDIVNAWEAANGTVKTMSALGRFARWLGGFAVIGVIVNWIAKHIN